MADLVIREDDLRGPEIAALLEAHLEDMRAVSPPESKHALDLEALRQPSITFWAVWAEDGDERVLAGCGALKDLGDYTAEVKSMRTARAFRGRGVASKMVRHIVDTAVERGYTHLYLETGSMPFFEPARRLYAKFGFVPCAPFGNYQPDPNSVFMVKVVGYD